MKRMMLASALLLVVQYMLFTNVPVHAQNNEPDETGVAQLWIDVGIGEEFVDWINTVARDEDIVRIDHLQMLALLDDINRGQRLVVVKTIDEAEQLLSQAADKIDIIGYNLEQGPANAPNEQAAPVASVRRMRELADAYGVQLAVGPDRYFALSNGVAMAEYADIMILQVQKVQEEPETVIDFVIPLTEAMRATNPEVQVSVQIGAQGDVDQALELIRLLTPELDGVSILTDHTSVDFSAQFVAALRAESSPILTPTTMSSASSIVPKDAPLTTPRPSSTSAPNDSEMVMIPVSIIYRAGFIASLFFVGGVIVLALLYARR